MKNGKNFPTADRFLLEMFTLTKVVIFLHSTALYTMVQVCTYVHVPH